MSKKGKELRHKAKGLTFFIKKLPVGPFLMALSESDKPKPPLAEVKYANGEVGTEINRRDKKYLRELGNWQTNYNARLFRLCVVDGIDRVEHTDGSEAHPTPDEIEELRFIYGPVSLRLIQHYWRAEVLGDTAEGFMNLVLGQTEIVKEGLEQDERRFRPTGEGPGVSGESDGLSSDSEVGRSVSDRTREAGSGEVRGSDVETVSETEWDE